MDDTLNKNFMLNKAILEGYHTLLTIGRFPICYINIEMDDTNLHRRKCSSNKTRSAFIKKKSNYIQLIVDKIQEH